MGGAGKRGQTAWCALVGEVEEDMEFVRVSKVSSSSREPIKKLTQSNLDGCGSLWRKAPSLPARWSLLASSETL